MLQTPLLVGHARLDLGTVLGDDLKWLAAAAGHDRFAHVFLQLLAELVAGEWRSHAVCRVLHVTLSRIVLRAHLAVGAQRPNLVLQVVISPHLRLQLSDQLCMLRLLLVHHVLVQHCQLGEFLQLKARRLTRRQVLDRIVFFVVVVSGRLHPRLCVST